MIVVTIGLSIPGRLVVAGYFSFVRPWSAMARDEEQMRRVREAGK